MIRYVAAGLAMMAGLVLLFMASFGNQGPAPTPVPVAAERAQPAANHAPPAPSGTPEAAQSPQALAALQAQIHDAARMMAALQSEVNQTRQDLASLQSQKQQAQEAAHPTPAPAAAPVAPPARTQAPAAPAPTRTSEPAHAQATQPFGFAPHPRPPESHPADAHPPERRSAEARRGEDRQPAGSEEASSASGVLDRLRQQVPPASPAAPGPSIGQPVVAAPVVAAPVVAAPVVAAPVVAAPVVTSPVGPHRIPASERLADARNAVVEGRIDDARRFLQAAQVQLVFRPVQVGEVDPPRVSQAAGPVAQALSALGYGDRGRALVAIDQAIGALDTGRATQQFGALPQPGGGGDFDGRGLPPPVPRNAP
ncbi:MAG: hypothetical protein P4L71_19555 [Acetobacteraceae bacterium]|nr:hypothetical protein [Acetobacteraceae bacterium]